MGTTARTIEANGSEGLAGRARQTWQRLRRVYSIVLCLILWEAAARIIKDPLFLPSPMAVGLSLETLLVTGELWEHVSISMARALGGFLSAAILGVALGLLMGWYTAWDDFWGNLISLTYPVPKIGMVPLFILWLGIGDVSKVAMIFVAAVFPVVINTHAGVKGVRKILIWRALTMGAKRREVLMRVVLPAALPGIFTGLRLAMGISWILLFAAEMVAARTGLGFLILFSEQMYKTDVVFAALVTIAALGFIFDRFIQVIAGRVCGWHFREGQWTGG